MPITQDRLLRLLEAGEQYQQLFDGLIDTIRCQGAAANQGTQTYQQALGNVALLASVEPTRGAAIVLNEERIRWQLTNKKNEWEKNRKAQQRGHSHQPTARAVRAPKRIPPTAVEVAAALDAEEGAAGLGFRLDAEQQAEIDRLVAAEVASKPSGDGG